MGVDVPLEDAARVVALAELAADVSLDEAKARTRVRQLVRLAEARDDGRADVVGPIPRGSALVLWEADRDPDDPDEEEDERDRAAASALGSMLSELVRVAGHDEFTVLVLPAGDVLELLDPEAMRGHGWYRSPGWPVAFPSRCESCGQPSTAVEQEAGGLPRHRPCGHVAEGLAAEIAELRAARHPDGGRIG